MSEVPDDNQNGLYTHDRRNAGPGSCVIKAGHEFASMVQVKVVIGAFWFLYSCQKDKKNPLVVKVITVLIVVSHSQWLSRFRHIILLPQAQHQVT